MPFQTRHRQIGLLGGVIVSLAHCLSSCRRGEEGLPRIEAADISLEVGLGGAIDRTRWNLLRLKARNQGEDFRGEVLVEGLADPSQPPPEPVVYRTAIEVPGKGTTIRELAFPVRPEGWELVRLTFLGPGYSKSFRFPLEPEMSARLRVLSIGRQSPDMTHFTKVARSLLPDTEEVETIWVSPADLPVLHQAFDPFGMVVLWGSTLVEAPEGAPGALERWVEAGGTLVVFPGAEWAGGLAQSLLDLLGVTAGDPKAPLPDALARRIGPAASSGIYREILPAGSTRTVDGGLAFSTFRGAGLVTTFAFRPAGSAFPEAGEAPALHAVLKPLFERALSFAGNSSSGLRELEGVAAQQLFAMSGFHIPGRLAVSVGLGVYLLLGFILPAFVFRRLRKPEWTFAWIIFAAGLSTWAIYRFGVLSAMEAPELEEITILRAHRDGTAAEATSFVGIIGPSLRRLAIEPPEGALPQPIRQEALGLRGRRGTGVTAHRFTVELAGGGKPLATPLTLYPNAMRYLRYDYRLPESPLTLTEEEEGSGRFVIRSAARMPLALYRFEGDKYQELETLRPGESFEIGPWEETRPSIPAPPPFPQWEMWQWRGPNAEYSLLGDMMRILARPQESLWTATPQGIAGTPAGGEEKRPPAPRWSFILALGDGPVFPGGDRFGVRKAKTATVLELPTPATGW